MAIFFILVTNLLNLYRSTLLMHKETKSNEFLEEKKKQAKSVFTYLI